LVSLRPLVRIFVVRERTIKLGVQSGVDLIIVRRSDLNEALDAVEVVDALRVVEDARFCRPLFSLVPRWAEAYFQHLSSDILI
jgi:hypothetical protein